MEPKLTTDVKKLLKRYLEIQEEEKSLREEKSELQQCLAKHLTDFEGKFWHPKIEEISLKIRYVKETIVEYDESLLSERLGDRYPEILTPDIRKIKKHLSEIEPLLYPVIGSVGSPDRDKVQSAITKGVVHKNEFQGAFIKTVKPRIAVMKARPESSV